MPRLLVNKRRKSQSQLSKPLSPKLRKHKKTYALTILGVRVVAGAVIGADVGEAIDTFDGMDIGDAGLTATGAGLGDSGVDMGPSVDMGSGADIGPDTDMGSGTADYSNVGGGGTLPMADPGAGGITADQVSQYMNSTIGMQSALDMSSLSATI
jgi:hypothetical protein